MFLHRAPLAAVAALLLPLPFAIAPLQGDVDKDELKKAASLMRSNREGDVRDGVELAVANDGSEAADILLETLGGQSPHMADIAWTGLPRLKTEAARDRVVGAIKKAKRNERMRQWCVEALGLYRDAEYSKPVLKALGDKSPYVRAVAAEALARMDVDGGKKLDKLAKDKDPYARGESWIARASLRGDAEWEAYSGALADPDGGVRCALLGALPRFYPDHAVTSSSAALADEDWRVRTQAVENLAEAGGREALDALVEATADDWTTVAAIATSELQDWTGMRWTKAEQWKLWLEEQGADYEPPQPTRLPSRPVAQDGADGDHGHDGASSQKGASGRAAPTGEVDGELSSVAFSGVRVRTDHVVFLIDKSRSMGEWLKATETSKEEAARDALRAALEPRVDDLTFNVVTYNSEVERFSEEPVELTSKTLDKSIGFLDDQNLVGNKDIWAALVNVVTDGRYDTVFLLSSGEPEIGLYVHHNRVAAQLAWLNRYHKVVVNTIAYSDSEWYRSQLDKISEFTGGEFRWYE